MIGAQRGRGVVRRAARFVLWPAGVPQLVVPRRRHKRLMGSLWCHVRKERLAAGARRDNVLNPPRRDVADDGRAVVLVRAVPFTVGDVSEA
eukprot:3566473-Prymnesium_polylepis.3